MGNLLNFGFPFTSQSGDRTYNASEWRDYFTSLLDNGVVGDIGNELAVIAQDTPDRGIQVQSGVIFINGALRKIETSTTLLVNENVSGSTRVDRVVARVDIANRQLSFNILQGTPGAGAPALTRDTDTFELSLAQISLANGYITITNSEITDERSDETLCGYFKYRAKPAWYPEDLDYATADLWLYTIFRNLLSAAEITDIEANSSLMAIYDACNINQKVRTDSDVEFNSVEAGTSGDGIKLGGGNNEATITPVIDNIEKTGSQIKYSNLLWEVEGALKVGSFESAGDVTVGGSLNPTTTPTSGSQTLAPGAIWTPPRGVYVWQTARDFVISADGGTGFASFSLIGVTSFADGSNVVIKNEDPNNITDMDYLKF